MSPKFYFVALSDAKFSTYNLLELVFYGKFDQI